MSSPSDTMRLPIWWIAPPRAVALRDVAVAVVVEPDVSASPTQMSQISFSGDSFWGWDRNVRDECVRSRVILGRFSRSFRCKLKFYVYLNALIQCGEVCFDAFDP